MDDHARVRLVEILHKLGLTEETVRDHVILPDHVRNAVLRIELHNVGDGDNDPTEAPPPSGLFYRLNVQKLSGDLHDLLSGCLAGYSMQLRATDERYLTSNGNRRRCPGKLASTTA